MKNGEHSGNGREKVEKTLENFQGTPGHLRADLFVIFIVGGEMIVRSTEIRMVDGWRAFWDAVSEWSMVELMGWCDDHRKSDEERHSIVASIKPALYQLNVQTGELLEIRHDTSYQPTFQSLKRMDKQFVFIDSKMPVDQFSAALRERFESVHEMKAPDDIRRAPRL